MPMRRTLFGNIGYGLDLLGTEETVTKLQAADLKAFHQKLIVPNNCVLAIFGDVKADEVKAAVEKVFANWTSGAASPTLNSQRSTLNAQLSTAQLSKARRRNP